MCVCVVWFVALSSGVLACFWFDGFLLFDGLFCTYLNIFWINVIFDLHLECMMIACDNAEIA